MASDDQGPDYRNDPGIQNNTASRTLDWGAIVRQSWGKEWTKRDTAYEFSNGRKMEDSLRGPYE